MDTRQELKDFATEYEIGSYTMAWRGKGWAIYTRGCVSFCYDIKEKDFVSEPMPSNRDEEFFKRCRFGLVDAKNIINQLNTAQEKKNG